ncbi:MAG: hypothetical protein LW750_05455 [Bacteroidetes bacterium]|jgi:hypothetical protein|nr:hypothetical protein [Bacteroidota bacterium]
MLYKRHQFRAQVNQELAYQNAIIEEKNRNTTDSINYAARIQSAVYQDIEILRKSTADAFVLPLPKDIVGGDFGGSRIAVMIFGFASQIAQAMESRAHL